MVDPFENRPLMCEDVDPFLQLKQLMEKSSFMNVTDPQFQGYQSYSNGFGEGFDGVIKNKDIFLKAQQKSTN